MKCEKCEKEYKLNNQDKLLRRMVALNSRLFPALKTIVETAKNYCNTCWKERVEPAARAMIEK